MAREFPNSGFNFTPYLEVQKKKKKKKKEGLF